MSGALINQTAGKDITWADNAYWGGSALGAEELKGLRVGTKLLDKKTTHNSTLLHFISLGGKTLYRMATKELRVGRAPKCSTRNSTLTYPGSLLIG